MPPQILRLVGMSVEELKRGFTSKHVFTELNSLINEASQNFRGLSFAVSHFARFEQAYLDRLWMNQSRQRFPLPFVCTHKLTKLLYPRLPNYGIRALAGWFGMPLDDGKRARNHVAATQQIWAILAKDLEDRGITTLAQLMDFLNQRPTKAVGRKEFLIPRQKRLTLPSGPGIYRYIDRSGRVLYVGKATSLKARVNSYFTGGCRSDHRKLEMLSQAVDVEVIPTDAPLFAGLLEYDEIRKLKPPYNIAFKGAGRNPLNDINILIGRLADLSPEKNKRIIKEFFNGLNDFTIMRDGIALWRSTLDIHPETVLTDRHILALGVPLLRQWIVEEKIRRAKHEKISDNKQKTDNDFEESDDSVTEDIWTKELVAQVCQRIVRRATRHHVRTRWLRRIAVASIEIQISQNSKKVNKTQSITFKIDPEPDKSEPDLRRTKVLLHELRRTESRGGSWKITKPWAMTVPFWI